DRVLDRTDDPIDVDLVEVVLLLEEPVAGPGRPVPSGEPVGAQVAEVVPGGDADPDEGDGEGDGGQRYGEGVLVDDLPGDALDVERHPVREPVEAEALSQPAPIEPTARMRRGQA